MQRTGTTDGTNNATDIVGQTRNSPPSVGAWEYPTPLRSWGYSPDHQRPYTGLRM